MDIQKLLSEMLKRTSLKEKVKRKNIFKRSKKTMGFYLPLIY